MPRPITPDLSHIAPKSQGPSARIIDNIAQAAKRSGVDFRFLMTQAGMESSFQPDAKATTSSAAGLYQFIEQTWIEMIQRHGDKIGLSDIAAKITTDNDGRARVNNPAIRKQILDLRFDPQVSASVGAEYAKENQITLAQSLGREIDSLDLYLAHFLGPAGATQFLKASTRDSTQPAANLLPQAAAANRSIFYDLDSGRALSIREVHQRIGKSFNNRMREVAEVTSRPQLPARHATNVSLRNLASSSHKLQSSYLSSYAFGGDESWPTVNTMVQMPTVWLLRALQRYRD